MDLPLRLGDRITVPEGDGTGLLKSGAGRRALVRSGAEFGLFDPNEGGQSLSIGESKVESSLNLGELPAVESLRSCGACEGTSNIGLGLSMIAERRDVLIRSSLICFGPRERRLWNGQTFLCVLWVGLGTGSIMVGVCMVCGILVTEDWPNDSLDGKTPHPEEMLLYGRKVFRLST